MPDSLAQVPIISLVFAAVMALVPLGLGAVYFFRRVFWSRQSHAFLELFEQFETGVFADYDVSVDPQSGLLALRPRQEVDERVPLDQRRCALSTHPERQRWRGPTSGNLDFDSCFPSREMTTLVATRLGAHSDELDAIVRFIRRWGSRFGRVRLQWNQVDFEPQWRFGQPGGSLYVSAGGELARELAGVADAFYGALRAAPDAPESNFPGPQHSKLWLFWHHSLNHEATLLTVGGFVVAFAFVALLLGGELDAARGSASWPASEGRVLATSIREEKGSTDGVDGPGRHGATTPAATYHVPVVEYEYHVNGKRYVGDRKRHTSWVTTDRGDAEAFIAKHPKGSDVQVFYDPGDPSRAVLIREATSGASAVVEFFAVLIAGSFVLLLVVPSRRLREWARRRRSPA